MNTAGEVHRKLLVLRVGDDGVRNRMFASLQIYCVKNLPITVIAQEGKVSWMGPSGKGLVSF